jgi:hypothetical protein
MKEKYGEPNRNGWQYYIDSEVAWVPMACQGSFCWLQRVWSTWPEKDGKPIMTDTFFSAEDIKSDPYLQKNPQQMYKVYFPYDPRTRK